MSKEKIPTVILRRSLLTGAFALACAVAGVAAGSSGDMTLTALSLIVAGGCLFRAVSDCLAAQKGKLIVLEGTCTGASTAFRRFKEITLKDKDGNESRLCLQKNVWVMPGESYRFYFRDTDASRVGMEYVDALLSVGNFLGAEKV